MLTCLLISVSLAKSEVYDIDLIPLRPLVSNGKILRLNISVKIVVCMHVLDAAELNR